MSKNMELDAGDLVNRLRGRIADNNDPSEVLYLLADALDLISRLSTAPAGDVVLLPREPTVEMLERGYEAYAALAGHGTPAMMDNAYRAMIAAAPPPSPQTSPATEGEPLAYRLSFNGTRAELHLAKHAAEARREYFGNGEITPLYAAPPPAKAGEGEVRVRPLEWTGDKATTPFGVYSVTRTPDGYQASLGYDELCHVGFNSGGPFESAKEAAKHHVEENYTNAVLSAIETRTP